MGTILHTGSLQSTYAKLTDEAFNDDPVI
jgi:hypothetical protein